MKFKIKTREQLYAEFDWVASLSTMVVFLGFLVFAPRMDKSILAGAFSRIYDRLIQVGLERPTTYKIVFYIALILFGVYLIKLLWDLFIKIIVNVRRWDYAKKRRKIRYG